MEGAGPVSPGGRRGSSRGCTLSTLTPHTVNDFITFPAGDVELLSSLILDPICDLFTAAVFLFPSFCLSVSRETPKNVIVLV